MSVETTAQLLIDLTAVGIAIRLAEGGTGIAWGGPRGAMTAALAGRARESKPSLLAWLRTGALVSEPPMSECRRRLEAELARRPWLGEVTSESLRLMFEWWSDAPADEPRALGRVLGNLREIELARQSVGQGQK